MKKGKHPEWNFSLFYKGIEDPSIEKDLQRKEKMYSAFAKKWTKDQGYIKSPRKLAEACTEYERLISLEEGSKPFVYLSLLKCINSADTQVTAKLTKVSERLTQASNNIIFFKLSLGSIDAKNKKGFLKHPDLKKYRYFLERVFKESHYYLSEKEEKILSQVDTPAHEMWVNSFEKILGEQVIVFENKKLSIPEVAGLLSQLPTKDRRKLHDILAQKLKDISFFAEAEINAIYNFKKIDDDLRLYEKPYSAMIEHNQDDEKTIEALVAVVTKYFKVSHRFYKAKAKLLKLKKLTYAERFAPVGVTKKKYSFEKSTEILRSAFGKVDVKYVDMLDSFLKKGQIDVMPRKGKEGGAFCWSSIGVPTFVMLNHSESFGSVTTFAHEMGHAFHGELSKTQSPIYQRYTLSVAEVASTLFENFAFDEVFETLTDDEKVIALHDRINGNISTIMRQVACFNFELELHTLIRKEGYLSKERIADCLNKHMKAYLGPLFEMKEIDGYFFTTWSHIRRFFYVYTYAFGEIVSKALYSRYKKDPAFLKQIEKFLSAGGTMSPKDIFASIGIDVSHPDFFEDGLREIEADVRQLEKLIG